MKKEEQLSNSFLVYGFVFLSICIYILAVAAVIHLVGEVVRAGFFAALSENLLSTIGGIISLLLVAPTYRLTKSLRILHLENYQSGLSMLTLYSPLFISDIPQADTSISIHNIEMIQKNSYFKWLATITYSDDGVKRSIKSFLRSGSTAQIIGPETSVS